MIRLIRRRLIIPKGDTGTLTIPTLGTVESGDIAILYIYNPLTKTTVIEKKISATAENLTFTFNHTDTINIEPDKYLWDIKIYRQPVYDEEQNIIDSASVDSYYAAFKLPVCEIRG